MSDTAVGLDSPALADYADVIAYVQGLGLDPRVVYDREGVFRFRCNPIIAELAVAKLNEIWQRDPAVRDLAELYMLIGYSLSGFADVFGQHFNAFGGGDDEG